MNGRITIMLAGVGTPLTFGMMAIEEFGNRQGVGGSGWAKLMTDLIYAGYCNEEIVNGRNPALSYRDISSGVEELIIDKSEAIGEVYKCFEASKAGSSLLDAVKKKTEKPAKEKLPVKKRKPTGTK